MKRSCAIILFLIFLTNLSWSGEPPTIEAKMTRVGNSDIFFPFLTRFPDKIMMKKVNDQIKGHTLEFHCSTDGGPKEAQVASANEYQVEAKIAHLTPDIFSIDASASYYCGGAYPTNDSDVSITFDLKSGKQVRLEELFVDYERDKKKIISVIFSEQLARTKKLVASGTEPDGSCETDPTIYTLETLMDQDVAFSFYGKGLQVKPNFPHGMEACIVRVIVPYEKLKAFADPAGLLSRMR